MVRNRVHAVAALLLLAASVSADLQPRSGGESNDALALIQRSLKSGSEAKPQKGAAGMTPEERQKEAAKKRRKAEHDAKAKGCPAGYSMVAGDVAGGDQFGRDGRHKTDTVELCAEDCTAKPDCKSFEWSPNAHTCNANKESPAKFAKPYQDFMLCVLNATQGPPAAPATQAATALASNATVAEGSLPSNEGAAKEATAEEAPPKEGAAQATDQPGEKASPEGEAAGAAAKPEGEAEPAAPAAAAKAEEEDSKLNLVRGTQQESSEHEAEEAPQELKRQEAEHKVKEEAQRVEAEKAEQEAEQRRQKEAERKAEEEAERAEKERAAQKAKEEEQEEAERLKQQEVERKAKGETERAEAEEAARKAEEEAERLKQQEAEHKAEEEAERAAKQEAEHKAKEEAERAEAEEAARKAKEEEAEQLKQQEAERKAREEAERAEAEEAARKAEEEAPRLRQAEAEREARAAEAEAEEKDEAKPEAAPEAAKLDGEEAEGAAKDAEPPSTAKAEKEVKLHRVVAEAEAGEQEADGAKEEAAHQEAERLEQEGAERKAREEAQKAKELADRLAREEAEHKARQEAELKAKAEAEKLEKEKAKQEADRKAKEAMCSTGYHFVDGDVPGWDQFGHDNVKKANINLCRRACDAVEECLSYEWSPTTKICSLNKDHEPSLGRFEDYIFCQRSQAHLDKLAAKKKAAEEQAARLASEREAAAQVAKAESDQELQGLRELAAHEAQSRLEKEERRKAEEAQRLAEQEAEKERKAREREEARKEAEMEKDLINIDEAAAADEEEERQKLEKQKAEEAAARLEAEEQARKKAEEEAAQQRKIEEEMEAERRAEEEAKRLHEEEQKRQAEEEARAKAEEEAKQQEIIDAVRRAEEMEQQNKVDEAVQQEAAAEAARKAEEEKKRQEEEQQKAEEEARLQELEKTDPMEAAIQRRRAEVKAKMAAALERKRLILEKKRKKEEAQGQKIKALEDEIKERQKEDAERRIAEEAAARKKEEDEQARREAEHTAAVKAEEEAREKEEAERAKHTEAEEAAMERKVMAASRPFEVESLAEPVKTPQITLRIQDTHGKMVNMKVARSLRFKVMMRAACTRLGISHADAQFFHGGRQLTETESPESFGLAENDLVKVDDFIKVDDLLAEEESKDEDDAAKAAREMFEAAQREWEGGRAKDAVVELTAAEKAQISERDSAEARKWQASTVAALKALPAPRTAEEARLKAKQVVSHLSEEEIAGLIYGTDNNAQGYYLGNTRNISHFDIPNLRIQDAAYRYKKFFKGAQRGVTCWPSGLALASTWDEQLVGRVGSAMAVEMRGKGANVMIGPSISVLRVASGGRNFEQLSGEDPYLGARLVKPYIRAAQKEGVIASVRPFGFYQQETNRKVMDVEVSEKVAWELYYPPFEAAVQAGVGAMTCSTAKVNGTSGCENSKLLKQDLKGTMKFKGFIMSEESLPSTAHGFENGLDMNMPGSTDHEVRVSNLGSTSAEARQEAATNVLTVLYRSRVDEMPMWQPSFGTSSQISNQRTKENVDLANEAAAKAVTLLKNNGVLPLDPSSVKRIAVLGSAASTPPKVAFWNADYYSGGGNSHIPASNGVEATALNQITRRAAAAKITVKSSSSNADIKAAQELAKDADVVIVVGATTSSEGSDRSSLALDDNVDSLIAAVAPLKPTVVLMQTPGAVLTPWRNDVAAVANLFLAGEATGAAWASMLFGDVTPAGKLPLAMPKTEEDTIRPKSDSLVRYTEGLRTSYRSNTFAAAFHFGHGLSYTEFTYSAAQVMGRGCLARACIRLEVSNTGSRPGSEVVQAYLQFDASENMPGHVLRSFHKTAVIQPGEKEEVFLVLTARDLSTYHPEAGWVEQSNVKVDIGSSSMDIRQSVWVNVAVTVDTV